MLTLAQTFSDTLNEIDDKYIMEAIEYQHHKTKHIQPKWILIAAALLIGLTATAAAAVRFFGLQDLVLTPQQTYIPNSEIVQTDPERPALSETAPVQTNTTISLSGYMNTPESQALAEWQAFLDQYDQDHTILNSVGNHRDENLWQHYNCYLVYTQEMANELERIANKYSLMLHTENYDLFAHPELLTPCEGYLGKNRGSATYMYEDGSFHVDGMASVSDFGIVDFQLARNVRGSLHSVYLTLNDLADYREWNYETACGVPVVLALGPGRALVLADLKDSFVTVLGLAGTDEGMTQAALEQLADSFDFTKLDPVVVPDLTDIPDNSAPVNPPAAERTTARETYAAVLRDLLYSSVLPDRTTADHLGQDVTENQFAVLDVNGDDQEDLILLYTTTYTAARRGMVLSFDGTYTGTARPIYFLLDEYPMLTFYDSGYIVAGASHNQTWSEFWPYTLYEMIDYHFFAAADVSALDKKIMEAAGKGEEYPDDIDVSKTGRVYQVAYTYNAPGMQPGPYCWDATEYDAWFENAFYGVQKLEISYQALSEENIRAMEME